MLLEANERGHKPRRGPAPSCRSRQEQNSLSDRVATGGHSFLIFFCAGQFPVAAHVDFHMA